MLEVEALIKEIDKISMCPGDIHTILMTWLR